MTSFEKAYIAAVVSAVCSLANLARGIWLQGL